MTDREIQPPVPAAEPPVPWSVFDTWLGVVLLAVIDVALLVFVSRGDSAQLAQSAGFAAAELAYLLPVILILAWRRISWRRLGFGGFQWSALGMGCGLLVAAYMVIILHNLVIMLLGIDTQGDQILKVFNSLESPFWLFIVGVVLAPLVEEIFFRGFLFQGFRQRYGWTAGLLISSAIFAAAHLDPVSFIPTFALGLVLGYVYHRSNSVWPGIALHFLVNAFGLLTIYLASQLSNFIPS